MSEKTEAEVVMEQSIIELSDAYVRFGKEFSRIVENANLKLKAIAASKVMAPVQEPPMPVM